MNKILSQQQIRALLDNVKGIGKGLYTNYFPNISKSDVWINKGLLHFENVGNTVFILKRNHLFINLFYISPGIDFLQKDLSEFLQLQSGKTLVVDVIGSNEMGPIKTVLTDLRFYHYTTLVRMSRMVGDDEREYSSGENISYLQSADVAEVAELFEKHFDPLCEQVPLNEEIVDWADKRQLVVSRDRDNTIRGFVIFEKMAQTAYLRYWFVHPAYRNMKVGSALLHKFFSDCRSVKRQLFWVIGTNLNAIMRYEHFGFKAEALFDYIYINKQLRYEG